MSEIEIEEFYGHTYTAERIEKEFPYSGTVINQNDIGCDCRVTYDCFSAMQLRLKNIPIIEWGAKLNERTAFVFQCPTPKALAF